MDKSDFVGNMTKAYEEDAEAFKKEIRAAYKVFFPIVDTEMDCKLDQDEFIALCKGFAHNSDLADLRYFKAFNMSEGIPIVGMVDDWTQFLSNETKVEDGSVEAIHDL